MEKIEPGRQSRRPWARIQGTHYFLNCPGNRARLQRLRKNSPRGALLQGATSVVPKNRPLSSRASAPDDGRSSGLICSAFNSSDTGGWPRSQGGYGPSGVQPATVKHQFPQLLPASLLVAADHFPPSVHNEEKPGQGGTSPAGLKRERRTHGSPPLHVVVTVFFPAKTWP